MTIRTLSTVVQEHYEWARRSDHRIPLGWSFFDQATYGGIALGEVLMMLAYSGVGKTWWACNVVINNPSVPTVFFSLEMQARALMQRLAAIRYQVPTHIIEGEVKQYGRSQFLEQLVIDYPYLMIDDTPAHSLSGMKESVDKAAEHWGARPKLVLADYLELIKAGPGLASLEAVDKVSRNVKNFARETDTAFIVLHQTNANEAARFGGDDYGGGRGRTVDNGHMALTRKAGRFGGDIAADYTVGCYRPALNPTMPETVRAIREPEFFQQLLKNRGGSTLHLKGVEHVADTTYWRILEKEGNPPHEQYPAGITTGAASPGGWQSVGAHHGTPTAA